MQSLKNYVPAILQPVALPNSETVISTVNGDDIASVILARVACKVRSNS